jgi:hypothetical protein
MGISDDPYFAGQVAPKAGQPEGLQDRMKPPVLTWVVVYVTNSIVPLYLGLMLTANAGRLGMFFALGLLLALVYRVISISSRVEVAFEVGGWVVAVSQFFPLLQVIAGGIGMVVTRTMGQATDGYRPLIYVQSELGGFVATILTGSILISVALSIGLLFQWIRSLSDRH